MATLVTEAMQRHGTRILLHTVPEKIEKLQQLLLFRLLSLLLLFWLLLCCLCFVVVVVAIAFSSLISKFQVFFVGLL